MLEPNSTEINIALKQGIVPDAQEYNEDAKRLEKSIITLNNVIRKEQQYIMEKYKISGQEMEILQYVIDNGPQKMKALSEYFNIKLSTLTSVVDKAEKNRIVKRVNSKDDRRVVYLEGTKKGKDIFDEYNEHLKEVVVLLKNSFDENMFALFVSSMEAFTRISTPS